MVEAKAKGETYSSIARSLGVSRQRVQQFFMPKIEQMREVAERAKATCEKCGKFDQFGHYHHKKYEFDILNTIENIIYLCISCHSIQENGRKEPYALCLNCSRPLFQPRKKFCGPPCRKAYLSITCECSNCHKNFIMNPEQKIRVKRSQSGLLFCTRKCQGHYWGTHINHSFSRKRTSKYLPLLPEIIMRIRTGESLTSTLRNYGISRGSYLLIKRLIDEYKTREK